MNLKLAKQNSIMLVDDILDWYDKNVNFKLTKTFINFLVKVGIIKKDLTLEEINLFLLERYGEEYVKEGGLFKIKKNRVDVIKKFPDKKEEKPKVVEKPKPTEKPKPKVVAKQTVVEKPKQVEKRIPGAKVETAKNRKFKIESLGGRKLKLVRL